MLLYLQARYNNQKTFKFYDKFFSFKTFKGLALGICYFAYMG